MKEYRLNVRFNLDNETDRDVVEYLKTLNGKRKLSRNQFIIAAIRAYIAEAKQTEHDEALIERLRTMFRDELRAVSFVSASVHVTDRPTLTPSEDDTKENEMAVLEALDIFG